jgi:hypothetical protein
MKEHPILFSAPMVRALLDGSKTQTRRVVKPQPIYDGRFAGNWKIVGKNGHEAATCSPLVGELCPHGRQDDRLWVRENFADLRGTGVEHRPDPSGPLKRYAFAADHPPGSNGDEARKEFGVKWKPSIHMPRAASRITLEITGVRVERLQDISEADAVAEGVRNSLHMPGGRFANENFAHLWWAINGDGSWEANPWVWVVEFKRVEGGAA